MLSIHSRLCVPAQVLAITLLWGWLADPNTSLAQQTRKADSNPGAATKGPRPPSGSNRPSSKARKSKAEPETTMEVDKEHQAVDDAAGRGDYAEVINLANLLIQKSEEDFFALHLRATARIELGRQARNAVLVRDGIADASLALKLHGRRSRWLYVPYLYGLTSLTEIENRPEHAALAITVVDPVLKQTDLPPGERANLLYQRGLAQMAQKAPRSALKDFDAALGEVSEHTGSLIKRAECLVILNENPQAEAAYDKAVQLAPKNAIVFNERGAFRRRNGQRDGAVADFSKAIELQPKLTVAYVNRAIALSEQNLWEAAETDLNQALELSPDQASTLRLRAQVRVSRQKWNEAASDLAAALKILPDYSAAREDLAILQFYQRDFKSAADSFQQVLSRNSDATHLVPWLVVAYRRSEQSGRADELLQRVITKQIAVPDWIFSLCKYLAGQLDQPGLMAAVAEGPAETEPARKCEAWFFTGQKRALDQDTAGAAAAYQLALSVNAPHLIAYRGAQFETQASAPPKP